MLLMNTDKPLMPDNAISVQIDQSMIDRSSATLRYKDPALFYVFCEEDNMRIDRMYGYIWMYNCVCIGGERNENLKKAVGYG